MYFAFIRDNRKLVYKNGVVEEYGDKLKVRDEVIGYVLAPQGDKLKQTKVPVYDCSKVNFSGTLKAKADDFYVFESPDALCLYFGSLYREIIGYRYDIVAGRPIVKGDRDALIRNMDSYEVIQFALKNYSNDPEVLRNAVIGLTKLGKCEEAISLYSSLDKKYPEESLAVAECYEKVGKELEALKIYSFFSEDKYRELEAKLRERVDNLIAQYNQTNNVKPLLDALEVLPTYDAPALKLGWHYLKRKNWEEAVKYFEEAVKRSNGFQNLLMLAYAYVKKGEYKRAFDLINNAEKIRRTAYSAYLKGLALEGLNASKNAEKEFIYACKEGVVEACDKVEPSKVYSPKEFSPEQWLGYVLYGYEVKSIIGNGGMGYVLMVEKNGKRYAMKIMKKEYKFSEMLYEVAKMQEISKGSRYVVRILSSFIDENWSDYFSSPPAIVMEYMEGGDLRSVLVSDEYMSLRHSVKWPEVVAVIFSKVAQGVIHMHKEGYVHCDIKPSNILFTAKLPKYGEEALNAVLNEEVTPKLSDLGSAVKLGVPVVHYTPYYAHPVQRFGNRADYSMDAYSFVVSLYVALTNNFPFSEWLEREIEDAVTNSQAREQALRDFYNAEPRMDYVPNEYRWLIEKGLRGELTMEEIARELRNIATAVYGIDYNALAVV
ncbi:MAG: protein kinase [Candidatus Aramenus sulfurataquae]|uniref:Protein kinase n=2 Tax=Candidatus Aramenus sulfurataquae TaxID=1326980 RepID=A0A0F2LQ14_9CREN|nr:protein kinase [Candidatus Aramenus sp.]MCL7343892.1 protein kinase [Candidatus Aramenus sulfurataquae]